MPPHVKSLASSLNRRRVLPALGVMGKAGQSCVLRSVTRRVDIVKLCRSDSVCGDVLYMWRVYFWSSLRIFKGCLW